MKMANDEDADIPRNVERTTKKSASTTIDVLFLCE